MHRANAEYLERLYQQYLANPHALEARWHAFFKQGVLLDLWCYRRHGHHETDDSMFTQPCMYEEIAASPHRTRSSRPGRRSANS
jgi:2-oxoglutarate dehydrogenase complex dehydrogenase (E1) component-like enzyme